MVVPEVKIITGVRDPFSRSISAYFEQIHYNGGIPNSWSYEDIKADFLCRADFFAFDRWIHNELIRFSSIDIFAKDFDKELGYCQFEGEKTSLFIYRLDKLSTMTAPISRFCGEDIPIESTNFGSANSGDRYSEFVRQFKFDSDLAKKMSAMKSVHHFYSESEIESLLRKWT